MVKKNKFKYNLLDVYEGYLWIVGLSLFVVGIVLFYQIEPKKIIMSGLIITIIASIIKGLRKEQ